MGNLASVEREDMMNETIESMLDRRTIREFQDRPVPQDVRLMLEHVMIRAACSTGLQSSSVIRVTDPDKRRELARINKQEYAARMPEVYIFIVDVYRNNRITDELGLDSPSSRSMDRFFQGFSDAVITAADTSTAANTLGLGTAFMGSILNDPDAVIELFDLPEVTFPALGLGFGYPNQEPQLKPRMDRCFRIFENTYEPLDGSYVEAMADYDEVMKTYYDLRDLNPKQETFTGQLLKKYAKSEEKRARILRSIRRQGFDLMLED